MSLLPARSGDDGHRSRETERAVRADLRAELAIFGYEVDTRIEVEWDRIDTQAAGDMTRAALNEEMDVLDWGLQRANGSPARIDLVSRKVNLLADANTRRIARRLGGR